MLTIYPACFFKEKEGYSVIFSDLNWLATQGSSLEEAMLKAIDCLAGYVYCCQKEGIILPKSSELSEIIPEKIAAELEIDAEEAFVNLVSVDVADYAKKNFEKSIKKTLSIPAWLNEKAIEMNINFSQTLQEALLQKCCLKK